MKWSQRNANLNEQREHRLTPDSLTPGSRQVTLQTRTNKLAFTPHPDGTTKQSVPECKPRIWGIKIAVVLCFAVYRFMWQLCLNACPIALSEWPPLYSALFSVGLENFLDRPLFVLVTQQRALELLQWFFLNALFCPPYSCRQKCIEVLD